MAKFYGNLLGDQLSVSDRFKLDINFIDQYRHITPNFGYNGLGEIVYLRTYARENNGKTEQWIDTVEREVNGVFEIYQHYVVNKNMCNWDQLQAKIDAEDMFDRIFHMKFLPPGRGLWAMGAPVITKKGYVAALNNCAFVSTAEFKSSRTLPFTFLMDASMLGVGVGFDTVGAGMFDIVTPSKDFTYSENFEIIECDTYVFEVPDTREGWVESVELLLKSYFYGSVEVNFDYSKIREPGVKLQTFGGTSSGPQPLINLHNSIKKILEKNIGNPISVTCIVDIMNMIGVCTISGNIRRSAEIAFGQPDCKDFLDLKSYKLNPERQEYGWASNNSVMATLGMDYTEMCSRIINNGEPGFAWLSNMQSYSRMNGDPDNIDRRVLGGNPCLEQSLESMELCCLVETFPYKHTCLLDFEKTLRSAFLYAKIVTLLPFHWKKSNEITMRNRRIGCSVSGIAQFITKNGIFELKKWLETGYNVLKCFDNEISEKLCIRNSIKLTSVKPSGTISLLAGATPGIHYPESRFYIRRLRLAKDSILLEKLKNIGYNIEPCAISPETTTIVEFPIKSDDNIRSNSEVSMWEQLELASFMQKYWADNQVSATITFDPITEGPHLNYALQFNQFKLKGISFLPKIEQGSYPQMPYEAIEESKYNELMKNINLNKIHTDMSTISDCNTQENKQTFCDNDHCFKLD